MEGEKSGRERAVRRSCESHRLEQQVLTLAYEQLWPIAQVRAGSARTATEQVREQGRELKQVMGG